MPRYFLDFTDTGELLRDDEGMELVDLEAARMEALASLGEIAKDQLRDGDRRDFIIDIRETINNAALLQNRRTGARGDGWETEMEDATLRAALKRHWDASDASDFDAEHEIYREDAVLDYPQSVSGFAADTIFKRAGLFSQIRSVLRSAELLGATISGSLNSYSPMMAYHRTQ